MAFRSRSRPSDRTKRSGWIVPSCPLRSVRRYRVQVHKPLFASKAPARYIAGDAIQVGRKASALRFVPRQIAYQRDEHLLSDILGDGWRAGHGSGEAVDDCLIPSVDRLECIPFAVERTSDELGIAGLCGFAQVHLLVIDASGQKVPRLRVD
jgi:hypothetical protein